MIEKIISGGQTGVDQAALLVATELGIEVGGWCPKGGLDENKKCILNEYPSMKQTKTTNPEKRTKLNVESADGTLIIVPKIPLPEQIKDGTLLTIDYAKRKKKTHLLMSLDNKDALNQFKDWINEYNISVLNIAGPRESNWPGINNQAVELLRKLIKSLQNRCYYC